ncbi:hypothetical protein WMY93_012418 [Mugilogobius chulae]|uniref:NECAP PHear domain-containing protein n=1 Tax=Mugilogobius chulae TaxID=88201 RepID=A0AAW0PE80_9GOBI
MDDEDVADSWEEAADSGEIERRLEAKLKINQEAKKASSRNSTVRTAIVIQDDTLPAAPPPQIRILKRPTNNGTQTKTLAQREAEYAEARRRILGSASSEDAPQDDSCQDRPARLNVQQQSESSRPNNHIIRQPTGPDDYEASVMLCGASYPDEALSAGNNQSVSLSCRREVHVYRIPPRASNRGYRAADWKLDEPAWSGRMKITAKGKVAFIKLEDKNTGELFAQAPVDQYPGVAVEAVTDSSRYFVVRIDDGNGRHAFIGVGFADRGDSFDFNVALQDHFKWVKQEGELAKLEASQSNAPKLDLGFKEGQTIKISIGNIKKKDAGAAKPRPVSGGLLPPPPGAKLGGGIIPPPVGQHTSPFVQTNSAPLLDLGSPVSSAPQASSDLWGDFTSAGSNSSKDPVKSGWVQFS